MAFAGLRHGDFNHVALGHAGLGVLHHDAVQRHQALGDQPHEPGARQVRRLWHIARKRLIKARRRITFDLKAKRGLAHG